MALRLLASAGLRASTRAAPVTAAVANRNFSTTPTPRFLSEKTGQTGATVLGLGAAAYLLSKEVVILHSETVVVVSMAGVTYGLVKYAGGEVAAMLDERAQNIHNNLSQGRNNRIAALEAEIATQEGIKEMLNSVDEIYDIHRELNAMEREVAFRMDKKSARDAAVKQLTEIIAIEASERANEQKELVAQLRADVLAGLKGQESAILQKCIQDLTTLSKA
eukprot:m.89573 g.89573  ORF g.89573 m.89573 type:complete len:220 (+) comp21528_c1_seq1:2-661(+)